MISEGFWSEWGDLNTQPRHPKPMSKPSGRTVSHSLALSGTPAVPLWNSIGLFISATAFGFWDLCGIEFCMLKVLPTGFTSNSGCFLPQRAAQKLRRINKEISAGVILPTLSINGKCVVVAKTPSENVQTKKKLAHFLWLIDKSSKKVDSGMLVFWEGITSMRPLIWTGFPLTFLTVAH